MIQLVSFIQEFLIETFIQKSQKIENNDNKYFFFSFFYIFLINHRFWLRSQWRNEFCMQKYPNKHNFIGFENNSHLSLNFC